MAEAVTGPIIHDISGRVSSLIMKIISTQACRW